MIIKYTNYLKLAFVALLRTAFGSTVTPSDYRYMVDENDPNCKLRIYRAFPQRILRAPLLVVSAEAADARFRYVGDETVHEIFRVTTETVVNDTLLLQPYRLIEVQADRAVREDIDFTLDYRTGIFTWLTTKPATYTATYDTLKHRKDYAILQSRKVESQLTVPIRIQIYALSTTDRERLVDLVTLYVRSVFRERLKTICTYTDIRLSGETQTLWDNQQLFRNDVIIECWTHYANEIPYDLYALIEKINLDIVIQTIQTTP